MTAASTRCLIADDQAMVREGFGALLAPSRTWPSSARPPTAPTRSARPRELHPDVILMDVRMPVMDGLEATRRILDRAAGATPRVLMLTTFDLDDYVYEALRAGASGFLLKDAPADELVHAVRVVAAGDALLAPSVTRRLIADFAARREPAEPPASLDALTRARDARSSGWSPAACPTPRSATPWSSPTDDQDPRRPHPAKLDLRDRAQAVVARLRVRPDHPGG